MNTDKLDRIALEVANDMPCDFIWYEGCGHEAGVLAMEVKEFSRRLVARIQQEAEPVARVIYTEPSLPPALEMLHAIESLPTGMHDLYTFPPAQPAQSAEAPKGWISFAEKVPPKDAALDDQDVTVTRTVMVTNNILARNRMGQMSHVWFAMPIYSENEGGWVAYDDGDRKIIGLTHWLDPLAAAPARPVGGEGE